MKKIAAVLVLLMFALPVQAATTLQATADSYTRYNQPNANFGGQSVLRAGYSYDKEVRTYIRFVSPVSGTGKLRIYVERSNGHTIRVYTGNDNWTEGGITWKNQPSTITQVATFTSGWGRFVTVTVPVKKGSQTFVIRKFVGPDPGPVSHNYDDEVSRFTSSEGNSARRPTLTVG